MREMVGKNDIEKELRCFFVQELGMAHIASVSPEGLDVGWKRVLFLFCTGLCCFGVEGR